MNIKNQTLVESREAQDLAGKAILFEIGSIAGILDFIENNDSFKFSDVVQNLSISRDFLQTYIDILVSLDLLVLHQDQNTYFKSDSFNKEKNKVGYISWGMNSCAPLIENTQAFIENFEDAIKLYHRDGAHVALTSKWMGEKDFYPYAEEHILKLNPSKVIDLGSGTCRLLIRLAKLLPEMIGIGVDISDEACKGAQNYIRQERLENRIEVVCAPIQNLFHNKDIFLNTDVVHAGFVFHDLLPDEEKALDRLLAHIHTVAPQATLVIVDAIPFSQNVEERAFSGAFSFLHRFYMGREFLKESEWKSKLEKAGFRSIQVTNLGISGGRLFVAHGNHS